MGSTRFLTVLIDTYNHEAFIEEAIQSVLDQTLPASDTEIVVVDDGSTDRTPQIVRKFAPRVCLLRKVNGGQASAFNAGLSEARGEIVAFLDGDDWWAPGKLAAVAEAFEAESDVGLVGHGITEVYPDGRQRTERPRERSHFRIASVETAKKFRMQRGFLGSSRMAYRREILQRVGLVPEALKFEADEYLSTLAALLSNVVILRDSLTFYRVHAGNLFRLTTGDPEASRRKQRVLTELAAALRDKLRHNGVPVEIATTILECIEVEAEVLRLALDSGWPWETIGTELRVMRVFHGDASFWQHSVSCLRLVPALFMRSGAYYRWRRRFTLSPIYREFRRKFLPFPVPKEVERLDHEGLM